MVKKLTLLATAIAVVALAVPAFANATVLTENGVPVGTGSHIRGLSNNAVTRTPIGELECGAVEVGGEVTVNNGTTVRGIGDGFESTTECKVEPGEGSLTVEHIKLENIESSETGKGSVTFTFIAQLPGELECHFQGTVPGTFTEDSDIISIKGQGLEGTPSICGEKGEVEFEGDFTLTTREDHKPVTLD
jgi:hypothetical protein